MRKHTTLLSLIIALAGIAYAGGIKPGNYEFKQFNVPNNHNLGVNAINDLGSIVGYYSIPQGAIRGFLRSWDGDLTTLVDPGDQGGATSGFTEAWGINIEGKVVGEFYNTAAAQYSGFLYHDWKFTTYNLPGLPAHSTTAVYGINDLGDFCGFYSEAPSFASANAYVNQHGKITQFSYPGSSFTYALVINDFGQIGGFYIDSTGVYHSFFREWNGELTDITVPGATTAPGYGTLVLGLNNLGWMSGHFFDASKKEHGFVRSPAGQFFQIDVPGAQQTGGGGLNDEGAVVGHFIDSSGNSIGYIAIPKRDD